MASTKIEVIHILNCAVEYMAEAVDRLKEGNTEGAKMLALKAMALLEVINTVEISSEEAEPLMQAAQTLDKLSKKLIAR